MAYLNFIKKNITLNLLISVIVYNLISNLLELILLPLIDILIMDKFDLDKFKVVIKGKHIDYGLFIRNILSTLILLFAIYQVS